MPKRSIGEITKSGELRNKDECYLLYNHGLFGNRALAWNSYQEILNSDWKGQICMRGRRTQIKRGKVVYNVDLEEVPKIIKRWGREGIPEDHIGFNQSMPDKHLVLQGEVMRYGGRLYLLYTKIKKPMNIALNEETLHAEGLKAKLLLEHTLSGSSYSDLEALFETFPNSIVEFSSYDVPVGEIPGRNAVIWEVRNY